MNSRNIYSGFTQLTLNSFFSMMPEFFDGLGVLITCLDSNPAPVEASPWRNMLSAKGVPADEIDKALWIQASHVGKLFRKTHAFSGFDEIYLLSHRPSKGLHVGGHFTTDRVQFKDIPPDEVIQNMHRLTATRYLSDGTGIGLNFACESESLRTRILDLRTTR